MKPVSSVLVRNNFECSICSHLTAFSSVPLHSFSSLSPLLTCLPPWSPICFSEVSKLHLSFKISTFSSYFSPLIFFVSLSHLSLFLFNIPFNIPIVIPFVIFLSSSTETYNHFSYGCSVVHSLLYTNHLLLFPSPADCNLLQDTELTCDVSKVC